jgi:hypothetical protein
MKKYLRLIRKHTMKMYGGMEVQLHALLTSELDGSERSVWHPAAVFMVLVG